MSERIFGTALLLISLAGIWIGWDLRAPVEYEPVGPRAFPLLILALLALCALALMVGKAQPVAWAPKPVLLRVAALFVMVLLYAVFFERLGFVVSTALMALALSRLFGGSWKQSALGGAGLGVGLFLLFDRVLDVSLPAGLWLAPLLG